MAEVEEKRRVEKEHLHFKLTSVEGEFDKAIRELGEEKVKVVAALADEIKALKEKIEYNKGKSASDVIDLEKKNKELMIKLEGKYEKRLASDTTRHMQLKNKYDDLMVAATDDRFNMDEYHSQELTKVKDKYEQGEENPLRDPMLILSSIASLLSTLLRFLTLALLIGRDCGAHGRAKDPQGLLYVCEVEIRRDFGEQRRPA